jgi:hypothetical protein
MSGFINGSAGGMKGNRAAPAPADDAGPSAPGGDLTNPLLQQAEQQLESKLAPDNKPVYMKIVVAGLHIALANGPDGFMGKLRNSRDPVSDCARGAASLVLIMRKEAKGVMPMKAGIPAGMTLLFHGLDFIDRAKIAKVAEPEIDRAATIFTNFLFHKLGITPDMLHSMTGKVSAITRDPTSMAAINMKAGLTRHPNAATPTPLPGGPPGGGGMINGGG